MPPPLPGFPEWEDDFRDDSPEMRMPYSSTEEHDVGAQPLDGSEEMAKVQARLKNAAMMRTSDVEAVKTALYVAAAEQYLDVAAVAGPRKAQLLPAVQAQCELVRLKRLEAGQTGMLRRLPEKWDVARRMKGWSERVWMLSRQMEARNVARLPARRNGRFLGAERDAYRCQACHWFFRPPEEAPYRRISEPGKRETIL